MALAWKPASGFRLLDFFGQYRDHVEQIAHDTVIRDLEDGRLHVLIDGHDGACTLHAHNMLDGAADAERNIKLRSHRLPGTADLPLQRQPAVIANRSRGSDFAAQR